MSGSLADLQLAKCIVPKMDLDKKRYYTVLQGPVNETYTIDKSTTYSNSSVIHSIIAPSTSAVFSRRIYLKWTMDLTFTTAAESQNGGILIKGLGSAAAYDSLRCNPINAILQTAQMTINNETFSVNVSDHIQALSRYHDYEKLDHEFSLSPSYPDQFLNYSDGATSVRNPLLDYPDNPRVLPRGSSVWYETVQALNNHTTIIRVHVCENLYLSPLIWGRTDNDAGLVGVQTIKFIFNLGQASRLWSHMYQYANQAEVNQITNISMNFPSAPELLYTFSSVSDVGVKYDPMEKYVYPYYELVNYSTPQTATLAAGASAQITTANIQLSSVPNKLYLFIAEDKNTLLTQNAPYKSDTFARINSISVQFNNQTGILSSANAEQLYLMSVANGLNMSWQQYYNSVGSIICLCFGKDVGLPPDLAPGVIGSFQLQITVNFTNQIATTYTNAIPSAQKIFMPWVVVVSEGTLTIQNQRFTRAVGILSRSDVVSVAAMPDVPIVSYMESHSLYGGSFLSGLKSAFSKVGNVVKDVATGAYDLAKNNPLVSKGREFVVNRMLPPGVSDLANMGLSKIGLGTTGGALSGGRKVRGGKIMSRKELLSALNQ